MLVCVQVVDMYSIAVIYTVQHSLERWMSYFYLMSTQINFACWGKS